MAQTWLVTGANRGIGLEYVRQLLEAGQTVIATAREPDAAPDLQRLASDHSGRLRMEQLDAGDGGSIAALAARLEGTALDVLVNNAGLYGGSWASDADRQTLAGMDYGLWEEIMRVNVIGPFRIIVALLANLAAGERKLVLNMSSDLGSIANNRQGQSHAYRTSKAALNMLTKGMAIDLADHQITVVSMAPGWTQTDLGGAGAQWPTADSVAHQLAAIAGLEPAASGTFVNLLGEPVAW